ncbi:MAG: hypothetical protein FWF29_11420 [Treponema sp.]|nr:hypothetical protein [Treponema sp.]
MKNAKIIFAVLAGLIILTAFSGCGPKGGVLILQNDSSLTLINPRISMGNHNEQSLQPGEWMKSNIDKNTGQFNIVFKLDKADKDKVVVNGASGSWTDGILSLPSTFTSSLVSVKDGDTVIITVANK